MQDKTLLKILWDGYRKTASDITVHEGVHKRWVQDPLPLLSLDAESFRFLVKNLTFAKVKGEGEVTLEEVQRYAAGVQEKELPVLAAAWMTEDLSDEAREYYCEVVAKTSYIYHTPPAAALKLLKQVAEGRSFSCVDALTSVVYERGDNEERAELKDLCMKSPEILMTIHTMGAEDWGIKELQQEIQEKDYLTRINAGDRAEKPSYDVPSLFDDSTNTEFRRAVFNSVLERIENTGQMENIKILGAAFSVDSNEPKDYYREKLLEYLKFSDHANTYASSIMGNLRADLSGIEEEIVHSEYYIENVTDDPLTVVGSETFLTLSQKRDFSQIKYNHTKSFHSQMLSLVLDPNAEVEILEDEESLMRLFEYVKDEDESADQILGVPLSYQLKIITNTLESYTEKLKACIKELDDYSSSGAIETPENRVWFSWVESKRKNFTISRKKYEQLMKIDSFKLKMVATDSKLPEDLHTKLLYHPDLLVSYWAASSYRVMNPSVAVEYVRRFNNGDPQTNRDTVLPLLQKVLQERIPMTPEVEEVMTKFVTSEKVSGEAIFLYFGTESAVNLCIKYFEAFPDFSIDSLQIPSSYFDRRAVKINISSETKYQIYLAAVQGITDPEKERRISSWLGMKLNEANSAKLIEHLSSKYPDTEGSEHAAASNSVLSGALILHVAPSMREELTLGLLKTRHMKRSLSMDISNTGRRSLSNELMRELAQAYDLGDYGVVPDPKTQSRYDAISMLAKKTALPTETCLEIYKKKKQNTDAVVFMHLVFEAEDLEFDDWKAIFDDLLHSEKAKMIIEGSARNSNREYSIHHGLSKYLRATIKDPKVGALNTNAMLEVASYLATGNLD